MDDHEALNQISDLLFGYREVPNDDLVRKISELRDIEKSIHADCASRGYDVRRLLNELTEAILAE